MPAMKRPIIKAAGFGLAASILVFWIPAFGLGWFDDHSTLFFLLLIYCPLLVSPVVVIATWWLAQNRERLAVVAVNAAFVMLSGVAALTWRSTNIYQLGAGDVLKTFFFLLLTIGVEVMAITLTLTYLATAIQQRLIYRHLEQHRR